MIYFATSLPSAINAVAPTVSHYGYLAVFGLILMEDFGLFFIPGESILIAAAFLAGLGKLNIIGVILVATAGATIGDNIGYAIGRLGGHRLVERWGKYILLTPKRLDRAEAVFKRYGAKLVVFARFVDLLRQVNGILAGIAEMKWLVFLRYNLLGALLWVGFWSVLGYFGGSHIKAILTYQLYVSITVVAVLVIYIGYRLFKKFSSNKNHSHPSK